MYAWRTAVCVIDQRFLAVYGWHANNTYLRIAFILACTYVRAYKAAGLTCYYDVRRRSRRDPRALLSVYGRRKTSRDRRCSKWPDFVSTTVSRVISIVSRVFTNYYYNYLHFDACVETQSFLFFVVYYVQHIIQQIIVLKIVRIYCKNDWFQHFVS